MFQNKIDEIFHDMPNVLGITYDILVIGYDEDGVIMMQQFTRCYGGVRRST